MFILNVSVDNRFKENRKALQFVDIGTKAKSMLNEHTHQLKIAIWTTFEKIA